MKKATVKSPANIAFTKYWGRRNDDLILPLNNSISMNLNNCYTKTTVEFGKADQDEVKVKFFKSDYKDLENIQLDRVINQVNRIRDKYKIKNKIKIYSENNFPADSGIASSASAFSALTKALYEAIEVEISEKDLTIETRLAGSGSATRSIPGGFVEWLKGEDDNSETSYARSIAYSNHWELYDITVVVDTSKKSVGSYEGHKYAHSEYMKARLENFENRNDQIREAILNKDIEKLGEAIEEEAISLHAVAMTSNPPIYYLNGRTWDVVVRLLNLRKRGILGYFTMDAGPNVHVICERRYKDILEKKLKEIPGVEFIITSKVCDGAKSIEEHLF
jgi:diphosphomevalonate decarboxylase